MEKIQASQVAKMVLFLILLIFIPFISSSIRPSYLYLLLNVLIVVLGVEAGLLTKTPGPREEGKAIPPVPATSATPPLIAMEATEKNEIRKPFGGAIMSTSPGDTIKPDESALEKKPKMEKKVAVAKVNKQVRRCPSRPSLFFIGGFDKDGEIEDHEEEEIVEAVAIEEVADLGGQELFHKAEMFIGNFYKQLKMQREGSWKKIHDLYHRAF